MNDRKTNKKKGAMNVNLENGIKDVIAKKLEDGTIENLIAEQLEKGVKNALENLFRSYGDVTKIIEEKVKSVMVPYLESYDYSKYITKLDSVLVDVLKSSALENKQLLENFKYLMSTGEFGKTIKVSEIFEKWSEYVSLNVETDGLKIDYDDKPTYENVEVRLEVEHSEDRPWSDFKHAALVFECDHDENMNFTVRIHRWEKFDKDKWTIDYDAIHDLKSLRRLNELDIFMMKLSQNGTKLILDVESDCDEVEVKAEPEATFS